MAAIESGEKQGFAARGASACFSYTKRVLSAYLDFAVPLGLLFVFGTAVEMTCYDRERVGLALAFYSQEESDLAREERFPVYQPGSAAQVKRAKAAKVTDAVEAV